MVAIVGRQVAELAVLSRANEGQDAAEAVLVRARQTEDPLLEAACLSALGETCFHSDRARTQACYTQALALFRTYGERSGEVYCLR